MLDRRDDAVSMRVVDARGIVLIGESESASSADLVHGRSTSADTVGGTAPGTGDRGSPHGPGWVADVARLEQQHRPRWVWSGTASWYPELLRAGVRIERCVDLRLNRAILRASSLTATSELAAAPLDAWDAATPAESATSATSSTSSTLFELRPTEYLDPLKEFALQRSAIAAAPDPARIGLLLAAESAGALIAAEMRHAGLPWDVCIHDALLTRELGPRPLAGNRPVALERALAEVRSTLSAPALNPDSPPELLKALAAAGISATSTRSWELEQIEHPAIEPLVTYKKLSRLFSANGWQWLDTNIRNGRFHPEFVPGGVVTGRWASAGGGGALQLPRHIRSAVVADPGWKLVVADAAQLEPRILAALSADTAMIEAGAAGDLYSGIVASGAVGTREHAKVAMLGAMYGATSGEAGRLMPRLARIYPRAIAFVEDAARAGERGEVVTTRLGRSSPRGSTAGYDETADNEQQAKTRQRARAHGRFTRNFVVQGTAAEWALCWMASLRPRLRQLGGDVGLLSEPHLVFFLHDEVVVHSPAALTADVQTAIRAAAADAGRLLFSSLPIVFPITVGIVDDYGQAK